MGLPELTNESLNLGWSLKTDLINILRRYIALLNGVHVRFDDRKQVIDMNNEIIPRLSMLSFGDNEDEFREQLDDIDDDLLKDLIKGDDDQFFILSWSMRSKIIETLIENLNATALFYDKASEDYKRKLIRENNSLIRRLTHLNFKPIVEKSDKYKAKVEETDSYKRNEARRIEEKRKNMDFIRRLKENDGKINQIKNVLITIDIGNSIEFITKGRTYFSNIFQCASLNWSWTLVTNYEDHDVNFIDFILRLEEIYQRWPTRIKLLFYFMHPTDPALNKLYIKDHVFEDVEAIYPCVRYVFHDNPADYINGEKYEFKMQMRVTRLGYTDEDKIRSIII